MKKLLFVLTIFVAVNMSAQKADSTEIKELKLNLNKFKQQHSTAVRTQLIGIAFMAMSFTVEEKSVRNKLLIGSSAVFVLGYVIHLGSYKYLNKKHLKL